MLQNTLANYKLKKKTIKFEGKCNFQVKVNLVCFFYCFLKLKASKPLLLYVQAASATCSADRRVQWISPKQIRNVSSISYGKKVAGKQCDYISFKRIITIIAGWGFFQFTSKGKNFNLRKKIKISGVNVFFKMSPRIERPL